MVAAAFVWTPLHPPVIEPAAAISHLLIEQSMVQPDADVTGREERIKNSLDLRKVSSITDHFIAESLLKLANRKSTGRRRKTILASLLEYPARRFSAPVWVEAPSSESGRQPEQDQPG